MKTKGCKLNACSPFSYNQASNHSRLGGGKAQSHAGPVFAAGLIHHGIILNKDVRFFRDTHADCAGSCRHVGRGCRSQVIGTTANTNACVEFLILQLLSKSFVEYFATIPKACGFEAATRFTPILLGGSLIPTVVYRDGDGFLRLNAYVSVSYLRQK